MQKTIWMKRGEEVREVEADPKIFAPLMAQGWHQAAAPKPAETQTPETPAKEEK